MAFFLPVPGLVIRYSYLWASEHARGQEEGVKDRPCAVVLTRADEAADVVVTVLRISHTPPSNPLPAVELPPAVKLRLKLDDERSWVVLAEASRFTWPGPDLRPLRTGDAQSVAYGSLPYGLLTDREGATADLVSGGSLDMMFVHPRYQGLGVASRLLKTVEDAAREQGHSVIVTEASLTARPFFERRGFDVIAAQEVQIRGRTLRNFRMERRLPVVS